MYKTHRLLQLVDNMAVQNDLAFKQERRLYLHETFLTEKIPEIAASSLVRSSKAASPQSQGSIAKILHRLLKTKSSLTEF